MDPSQVAAYVAHFHSQPPPQPPPQPLPQPLPQPPPSPPLQPQPHFSAAYVHPSPAPSPSSNPVPSHPSYTEMITAAILWENSQGKEGGSSKRAIAKYIDRVYSNLPPTHSALLTHHLIRLKNSGQLVMIKNSYQLSSLSARQPSPISAISPPPQQQQQFLPATSTPLAEQPSPVSAISPPLQQQQQFLPATSTPLAEQPSTNAKRRPGRPPKVKQPEFGAETIYQAKPESEDMGSEPLAGKKRRGRPAKVVQPILQVEPEVASAGVTNGKVEEGSLVKRRGRPKKKQKRQEVEEMDEGVVAEPQQVFQVEVEEVPVQQVNEVKRGAGRPKKVVNYNEDDNDNDNDIDNYATRLVLDNVEKRKQRGWPAGRPKKVVNYNENDNNNDKDNDDDNNATELVSDNVQKRKKRGWPAGRPRGKRVVAMAVSGVRRRGRKPKGSVGMVEKVYTGKTRGRPKKIPHGQEVANEELLRNLEDMQSKLRDAVGVLRPHVANLSAPDALIALQQLEELSTMNVTLSPALTALQVMNVPIDVTAPPPITSAPPPSTSAS